MQFNAKKKKHTFWKAFYYDPDKLAEFVHELYSYGVGVKSPDGYVLVATYQYGWQLNEEGYLQWREVNPGDWVVIKRVYGIQERLEVLGGREFHDRFEIEEEGGVLDGIRRVSKNRVSQPASYRNGKA